MAIRLIGLVFVFALCLGSAPASAAPSGAGDAEVDATAAPREVVAAQLEALQHNDEPTVDAGIATAWSLAHPANKLVTGPVERFARMIRGDRYRILIDHARHAISEISTTPDAAVFAVTITGTDGVSADFIWEVRRLEREGGDDLWRTIRVSPAALEGEEA